MAFKKGESGNPSGRPKVIAHVRDLAREHTTEAILTLVAIMQNTEETGAARVAASKEILDRGYGKPTQPISGDGDADPINIVTRIEIVAPDDDAEG